MMLNWYKTWDYKTRRNYWRTQRDAKVRCAEIRKNDNGKFDLMICEAYKSTHAELQEAMDEAKKYVGNHIVGIHEEKKGKWVERKNCSPYCSLCGAVGDGGNYCSHCGAKMIRAANNRPQIKEEAMQELFNDILRYGEFTAEFGCTNHLGMVIRVRVAEYDGKKYFIVQCNGTVAELLEI